MSEDYYDDDEYCEDENFEEEEETCPEGYTLDEDCGVPWRLGVEHCEFMCPWNLISQAYESESCWYCGAAIKRGEILCENCWRKK